MTVVATFANYLLGVLLYSGAVVPLAIAIGICRSDLVRRKRLWRLQSTLFFIQVACFVPFVIEYVADHPDFIHALTVPAITGAAFFLVGAYHLFREVLYRYGFGTKQATTDGKSQFGPSRQNRTYPTVIESSPKSGHLAHEYWALLNTLHKP